MVRIAATELMPDFSGRSLDRGRFTLLDNLGAGAYGKVYRAIDNSSRSRSSCVAIKCLNKPQPGSRTDILQQREFALHKLVSGHPNIVTFHGYFADPLYVYVVLDLCSGGDLFSAITEKRTFYKNGGLIRQAVRQLLDAVQYCHDFGVFHRDIKPENILCSDDGQIVRLADFGLCIKAPECQDFGCGSSYYMSPECIGKGSKDKGYSTRPNDIWALGVILTNMITGRNPWRYATTDDDCFAAYLKDHDFLRHVLPISNGVNSILKRIFTINPERRIALPDLRTRVVVLKACYIDEERALLKAEAASLTTVSLSPRSPRPLAHPVENSHRSSRTSNKRIPASESKGSSVFLSAQDDQKAKIRRTLGEGLLFSRFSRDHLTFGHGNSTSISGPSPGSSNFSSGDSRGPITPANQTQDPSVVIPDASQEALVNTVSAPPKDLPFSPVVKPKKSRTQLIRAAVQRIRGLTIGSSASS